MANVSFTESQSTLQGPNQVSPASGSVASISGMLHYRFKTDKRKAYFGQFTFPMTAGQGSYLAGGGGMEYYWGETTAQSVLKDATTSLTVSPIMRYFGSLQLNLAYLAYLTPTAKKNDTLLEIEGGGGLSRRFNSWTLRAQAGLARGIGVTTATMAMKIFVGGTFFLEE